VCSCRRDSTVNTRTWRFSAKVIIIIIIILAPQYKIPEGKILKTKQVRPQRRLLGGESTVEGDRISHYYYRIIIIIIKKELI